MKYSQLVLPAFLVMSSVFISTAWISPSFADGVCSREAAAVREAQPEAQKLSGNRTSDDGMDRYFRPIIAGVLDSRVEAYAKCLAAARHATESSLCSPERSAVDQAEADFEKIAPTDPADYTDDDATADFKRISTAESYNRCLSSYASEDVRKPMTNAQTPSAPVRAPGNATSSSATNN